MKQVEEKILTVNVVDVALVSVDPSRWPCVNNHERVASILETWLSLSRIRAADFKRMLTAELGAELVVGNVPPTMVRRTLRVLG
jgi:hypothetical protein